MNDLPARHKQAKSFHNSIVALTTNDDCNCVLSSMRDKVHQELFANQVHLLVKYRYIQINQPPTSIIHQRVKFSILRQLHPER